MDIVHTDLAPRAIGPYSQAVRAGNLLFLSGQIPLDPATGDLVPGGIREQTTRVLENLRAVLAAAGVDASAIAKATIFLTDLADFATVNELYGSFLGDHRPARSTVQVAALPRGARIELEVIAVCSDR
ncbi:MAG: RidA family protein [Deltaproteobacteria bacterium]|nr:RidA family protein [Deltaproteobacteria bacterium]